MRNINDTGVRDKNGDNLFIGDALYLPKCVPEKCEWKQCNDDKNNFCYMFPKQNKRCAQFKPIDN